MAVLGRDRYERNEGKSNHCNDSYSREFTFKGIGGLGVKVPGECKGEFNTRVLPRGIKYEDTLREDMITQKPLHYKDRSRSKCSQSERPTANLARRVI